MAPLIAHWAQAMSAPAAMGSDVQHVQAALCEPLPLQEDSYKSQVSVWRVWGPD